MLRFDLNKTLSETGNSFRQLSVLNPLTIHKKGNRAKAIFALALVCFFWGTTWIASRQGVQYMPALQLAGIRQFLAGVCFVVYFTLRGEKWPKGKEWGSILVLSFLNFFLSNGLTTWGVKFISAGLAAIIGAIFPLWLTVISLFSSKKIPAKAIAGLLIGFGGICIIFYEHLQDFFNADFRFGIFLSVAATWSWTFGTIYTKKHAEYFNPYFSLGLQMFISGAVLLAVCKFTDQSVPFSAIPWQSWAAISYLVVFGSVITFIAYMYALQHLSTEQVSLYAYVNPIVAVLIGSLFFNERLTLFIGIGGFVTLLGIFLVNKAYKISSKKGMEPETA